MVAILSPHFDDAVLSCWSVLTGAEDALVVNVFTGVPAPGAGTRWWDRMTGAADSAERMRERLDEDRAALALAGRSAVQLGLLDDQYRDRADAPDVGAAIARALPYGCRVYAPAGMGDHPDHVLVREAALALHRDGVPVTLYADVPHAITGGWPSWVVDGAQRSAVDGEWDRALESAGLHGAAGAARVRRLDDGGLARKREALRTYGTQLEALSALAYRPVLDPAALRYEVFWTLG